MSEVKDRGYQCVIAEEVFNRMGAGSGAAGVSSWNDLTDKPFGEICNVVRELEFVIDSTNPDNYTSEYVYGTAWFAGEYGLSDVSEDKPEYVRVFIDDVLVFEQWMLYFTQTDDVRGVTQLSSTSEWGVYHLPGGRSYGNVVIPKTGYYVRYNGVSEIADGAKCTVIISTNRPSIKTIDPKYLPDGVGGAVMGSVSNPLIWGDESIDYTDFLQDNIGEQSNMWALYDGKLMKVYKIEYSNDTFTMYVGIVKMNSLTYDSMIMYHYKYYPGTGDELISWSFGA